MPWASRFRERLVLGHVRHTLDDGERILAWAHAKVPGVRAPGVLLVTERRCLLHIASHSVDDRVAPWVTLEGWLLEQRVSSRAKLTLVGESETVGELSLSSRRRARAATAVVAAIAQHAEPVDPADGDTPRKGSRPMLEAEQRGFRGHARRVGVTIVGVLVLLLSALFASPFVPGPGALTALAGIAILAREYEWARDVHVWASRQVERFLAWFRRKRQAFAQRRQPPAVSDDAVTDEVREAA